jgi:hypothetical protein
MTNNTITTKNVSEIANFDVDSAMPRTMRESIVENYINPSKYEFLGFVDRTNTALLRARYYNVRDNKGRWARVKGNR